jgi:HAMP domain-containing protein
MELALTVVAIGSALGSLFIWGSMIVSSRADDAAEDLSDRIAHGDIIRLPTVSSFHDRGL